MSKYVFDTYAWIEYFDGSIKGEKVRNVLSEKSNEVVTNAVTAAEVVSVFSRRDKDTSKALEAMRGLSVLHIVDEHVAEETGLVHSEMKKKMRDFGLADAFVVASARQLNAKIVTGDPHFRNMKNVLFLN
jgi:predicted nucleic acid-binding protein